MADTTAKEIKELLSECVAALQFAGSVLRPLHESFTQINFTDRYGDAPKMAKALELIHNALEHHYRV